MMWGFFIFIIFGMGIIDIDFVLCYYGDDKNCGNRAIMTIKIHNICSINYPIIH